MTGTMLVTGATGVIGHELVQQAAERGWEVVGCATTAAGGAIPWVMGVQPVPRELRRGWDVIVHLAGRPRVDMSPEQAQAANVAPVLALAGIITPQTHLIHVSTAFATGLCGTVDSADLRDYRNSYEWSKAWCERVAIERYAPLSIVRPCLVIGRRSDGAVARFCGLYEFVYGLGMGMVPAIAGLPEGLVDLVSVCDVADCILRLAAQAPARSTRVESLGRGAGALTVQMVTEQTFAAINQFRAGKGLPAMELPPFAGPLVGPGGRAAASVRPARRVMEAMMEYLWMRDPLPVTWRVDPMEECLAQAVRWWAVRRPEMTLQMTAPWERR
ncbi:SDR family oxidoreductase [Actinoallomurus sp. NPDC050550]|uniref:NAD-dependent epimerase/dehydratase family protein n=1 Tax=Actinoallomurus sp. NPDC050550 TaxID=3154937 RepID=UPI0033D1A833